MGTTKSCPGSICRTRNKVINENSLKMKKMMKDRLQSTPRDIPVRRYSFEDWDSASQTEEKINCFFCDFEDASGFTPNTEKTYFWQEW